LVDCTIIIAKAGSVKRHLARIIEKRKVNFPDFAKDLDCQESILFNLQMAIQNCIDIAAHIISEEGFGMPDSTNEMFYFLEENGFLTHTITEKMVKAVGFRNLIVHEYGKVELKQVYDIAQEEIKDLNEFLANIFKKLNLSNFK